MKRPVARFIVVAFLMLVLMGLLIYRLGTLTIVEGASWTEEAESRMIRTIAVKGERGRILDRNGVVLAYSETCYNVEFLRDADSRTDYDSAVYTESLIKAIGMIEAGGGTVIDTSYIRMDENGDFVYEWGVESESGIKTRYKNFCDAMGLKIKDDPNISNKDSSTWDISLWPTAEYAYGQLRKFWYIPEDLPYEDAIKVISIRQEVNLNNYRAYTPITIAYDVGLEVVAELKMHSDELVGIQTSQSTTRVYPRGTTAAHLIGYLSRSATKEMVKELGYEMTDYIGVAGVEATMESYLTGATTEHLGHKTIEVNKNGSTIREIENTAATNGYDVMLTVDLSLQTVTEKALESLISEIAENQEKLIAADENEKYSKKVSDLSTIETAKTGAIVVMDVNSGQVRAMASYPSYDPNWFIQGLSVEQRELLFGDEAEATTPTRNKAISSKLAPGSIFKMLTGIAGIAEGKIGINETISDMGRYIIVNPDGTEIRTGAPKCWTNYPDNHANLDIVGALTNSCNYYFCEVAHRLGIDLINKWAAEFGLTATTGIELTGEAEGIIGGQEVMFDNSLKDDNGKLDLNLQKTSLPWLVYRRLITELKYILDYRGMEIDDEAVKNCALKLMELQDGTISGKGAEIRRVLSEELGIPEGATVVQPWVNDISSFLSEIQWKETYTIRSGFGQGVSLVTPVAIARYVCAIANEGTVYDAHIVDRIVDENGNLIEEITPSVYNTIDIDSAIWAAIKDGMKGVVSPEDQGTAAKEFSEEFKATGYDKLMSGKTGTAQVGTNTIDIENTSWFVMFAPRDDPEIVIVVCVPNGFSGASSIPAVEEILTYYFNKQNAAAPENLVDINGIVP